MPEIGRKFSGLSRNARQFQVNEMAVYPIMIIIKFLKFLCFYFCIFSGQNGVEYVFVLQGSFSTRERLGKELEGKNCPLLIARHVKNRRTRDHVHLHAFYQLITCIRACTLSVYIALTNHVLYFLWTDATYVLL